MKKLSEIKGNIFTTKLYDVIEGENSDKTNNKQIYLIMEFMCMDLNKVI